ncbi:RNA-guided endonuclease InsQ/TnpB family protein [Bacillus taeanensis]|uniref:Transposase n=1 Tax=Bacillus taeanensis TaxID=273032 RepID=A0A366XUA4_9BACI|nr:RNA-guided endonuclease TnpB family protein [Bacillus taeanensis]RBW68349.1 transposase [Bacillus taeanensis]
MYRTMKVPFSASSTTIQKLFDIRRLCAVVWNDCVQIARYYYRLGGGWITKSDLQKELKGLYPLHSQTVQAVAHKFLQAREGAQKARKAGFNVRYPWKHKFVFNSEWVGESFTLQGKRITLSLGIWNGKRQPKIILKLPKVPPGNVKEVELVYNRKWLICLSYEAHTEEEPPKQQGLSASIDPGEIHTISSVTENGDSLVITGRYLRSIHRLRNKKLKELQKLMSRCKKGSRQWRKYNRAKKYVLSKSDEQVKDALHKTTKQFVDWCLQHDVNHVVIGDVEGVQRNTKKKRSKNTNQKLSNWSFGKLYTFLVYKLKARGITIEKVDEHFTSQTCPVCGNRKKVSYRTYQCQCGYKEHRDLHGARNILTKQLYGKMIDYPLHDPIYVRPTYLQPASSA